jgi:hypothetical protein
MNKQGKVLKLSEHVKPFRPSRAAEGLLRAGAAFGVIADSRTSRRRAQVRGREGRLICYSAAGSQPTTPRYRDDLRGEATLLTGGRCHGGRRRPRRSPRGPERRRAAARRAPVSGRPRVSKSLSRDMAADAASPVPQAPATVPAALHGQPQRGEFGDGCALEQHGDARAGHVASNWSKRTDVLDVVGNVAEQPMSAAGRRWGRASVRRRCRCWRCRARPA